MIRNPMIHTEPLDTRPITTHAFRCNGAIVRFRNPLVLTPQVIGNGILQVSNDYLGIGVYGVTRGELIAELERDFDILWRGLAMTDDADLTKPERILKYNWIESVFPV